jgi:hypothetical protein
MYKFVLVLNKKVESGQILNVAGHMTAALVAKASEELKQTMLFMEYRDKDEIGHLVSGLSMVILRADNSNKIRAAREKAKEANVHYVDFIATMTENDYQDQMQRTAQIPEVDLEYWGLALFGKAEELNEITGKFSLYK